MPETYPISMTIMNAGLLPATTLVRSAFRMEKGQLAAKQRSIDASKKEERCCMAGRGGARRRAYSARGAGVPRRAGRPAEGIASRRTEPT